MSLNTMTVKQAAPLITAIYNQMALGAAPANIDPSDYVSLASTIKRQDPDLIMGAITQLWGRTIFSTRPYSAQLAPLMLDMDGWSLAQRKINYLSRLPSDNAAYKYPVAYDATQTGNPTGDGLSVDMYKQAKDKVIETVFYGAETWGTHRTSYRDQLRPAFDDPADLVRFNAGAVQEIANDRATWADGFIRGVMLYAMGTWLDNAEQVVHLCTEYRNSKGGDGPAYGYCMDNYPDFIRWVYARIGSIKALMEERNTLYTKQPAGIPQGWALLRHTPADRLRVYMIADHLEHMRTEVRAVTYNERLLDLGKVDPITYWQSAVALDAISVTVEGSPVDAPHVLGVMFDREALGVARFDERTFTTPFNGDGEYYNTFFKELWKNRFDPSEKAVVLALD